MNWRPVDELAQEVTSEDDLLQLRQQLVEHMSPSGWERGWCREEREMEARLAASPNPYFKKLGKDYEEHKQRARTLPKILPILVELGAQWRYINYGFQFKFQNRMLCWWPRTGAIDWQGQKLPDLGAPLGKDIERMLAVVKPHLGDVSVTGLVEPLPAPVTVHTVAIPTEEVLACLVCGGANVEQTCAKCARQQTDLCSVCFPRAHWCLTGSAA